MTAGSTKTVAPTEARAGVCTVERDSFDFRSSDPRGGTQARLSRYLDAAHSFSGVAMHTDALYPPPPPRTKHGISMKDLDVRIQHLEKEIEDLKRRLVKLEK
jgi:hypothetical protein